MPRGLPKRVVVITGASSGIGRAAALLFAKQGAHVVVAARRTERLTELCAQISAGGTKCLAITTDVAQPDQVQRLLDGTLEHFGGVDIWINNAGYGLVGDFEATTLAEMERLIRVNYLGAFTGCQVAIQQMRRQEHGHIINVASLAARYPLPLNTAYTATKCAIAGMSEALALELAGTGISVSTVYPGVVDTEFTNAMVKHLPDTHSTAPLSISPDRVADAIVRCALHPRPTVYVMPMYGMLAPITAQFPSLWRYIAKRYMVARKP